jgi:hypothetical protein
MIMKFGAIRNLKLNIYWYLHQKERFDEAILEALYR